MRPANWPRLATTIALSAGATLALIVSWPGHLSYDSIIQIHDGQTGFYHSWHPPVMAWLLGLLNTLLPGGALFVVLDVVIFFGALISLLWIKPQTSWAAFAFGILLLLLPQVWLYQTIVWKDVLFANASVAGFTGLIWTETRWNGAGAPRILLTASFAALVLATLTRQNGIIVLISGAACLGLMAFRRAGLRAAIAYCAIALAASTCVVLAVSAALALRSDDGEGPRLQLRLLHLYDLTGAVAREPSLPLEKLDANAPKLARLIRGDGARLYTPERNDTLVGSQALQNALAATPPSLLSAQWKDLVFSYPWLYFRVRASAFEWVLLTPDISACRPIFVGVDGPADEMSQLGLTPRKDSRDLALQAAARTVLGTPVFSHITYLLFALGALVVLLRRRAQGDLAMAAMLISALLFTASFFVISIACDYRYLYFLDMASLTAVFYLATEPRYLFQVVAM